MMFDRITAILSEVWRHLVPFHVVDEYERGVVLRWGKFRRVVEPGLVWLWPVAEVCNVETVVRRTTYLDVQSGTTIDGEPVNVGAIVVWSISNVRRFLLEVDEGETAVADVVYGVVDELVSRSTWGHVRSPEFLESVTQEARKAAKAWGWRCHAVKFSDRSRTRAIRLWQS